MKLFLSLLLSVFTLSAVAQLPPILRNPFTTNSNPNGLTVVQTNGVYELQTSTPLSIPGGLFVGGTNGAGTNNIGLTNFYLVPIPMTLVQMGTGVGAVELANTNSVGFLKATLKADNGKTTNFVTYMCYLPPNVNPGVQPHIILNVLKVGGSTSNAVFQTQFFNGSTVGTLSGAVLSTNAITGGSGVARATSVDITATGWSFSANLPFGVQIARVGDDAADAQSDIIVQSVMGLFHLK